MIHYGGKHKQMRINDGEQTNYVMIQKLKQKQKTITTALNFSITFIFD